MASSGTTLFQPSIADLVVEAYSRIQIRGPSLTTEHIVEARRSANLILQDWSANRSLNLWSVDLLQIPMVAGVEEYMLPSDTIQVLDVYLRTYSASSTTTTIGAALTPVVMIPGTPMVTQFGDPMTQAPGSGTLTSTLGSQIIQLTWPSHGLSAGSPIFITGIMSVGGLSLSGMMPVLSVIDVNNVTFLAPQTALETQIGQGAPPLFTTTNLSTAVSVIYPNHGLTVGDTFNVPISTTGGGVTLSGNYTVAAVTNSYQFTITAVAAATSTVSFFQNGGQFQVAPQSASQLNDNVLVSISRTEYASIPDKQTSGKPTTFWLNRVTPPMIMVWPVPSDNINFGMAVYRMRQIQDAVPVSGQTLDMPNRFLPSFTAELTAAIAEKYAPALLKDKIELSNAAWTKAAQEDQENVPFFITPGLSGYFR